MQRDVVDAVVGAIENRFLPVRERGHARTGAPACDQFDRWVDQAHGFGAFGGKDAVVVGRSLSDLPRTIHLIAQAPDRHVMRHLVAVAATEIAPLRPSRMVAVLQQVTCGIQAACAEIDRQHGLAVDRRHPVHELVGPDQVRFERPPGELQPYRPIFSRTHPFFPDIARDEVATGIANERHVQRAQRFDNVAAESMPIGRWVRRFVDPSVDSTAQVLDESGVDARIDRSDRLIEIGTNHRFLHGSVPHLLKSALSNCPMRLATAR